MSIKNMNYATVEQVLCLRNEALEVENQRDKLCNLLQEQIDWLNGLWYTEEAETLTEALNEIQKWGVK